MTYKTGFLKLTWTFAVGTSEEIAETGLHVVDPTAIIVNPATELAGYTTSVLTALSTAMGNLMRGDVWHWADYSSLVGLKVAPVGTDGHYTDAPLVHTITGFTGTVTGTTLPQSSVVASLRSASTFGTATHGRMYLPHTRLQLESIEPFASSVQTVEASTEMQTFIQAVNTAVGGANAGDVVSLMSAKGAGTTHPVSRVGVGNVTDTQRRRRNQLAEVYDFAVI
jgi:hypothetical protein